MELSTHDVVTMARDDVNAGSALIIPDAHGLVVAGRQNPGQFVMEEHRSDIIYMSF